MEIEREVNKNGYLMPPRAKNGDFMSSYTPEVGKSICEGVSCGKSTRSMLREHKIPMATFWEWLRKNQDLYEMYREAKENCGDVHADDIIDIADEEPRTFINKDGNEQVDNAWVNNQKNRIDARKWAAAVLRPKKYGNQTNVTVDVNVKLSERLDKILKDVTPEEAVIENVVVPQVTSITDVITNDTMITNDTNVNNVSTSAASNDIDNERSELT